MRKKKNVDRVNTYLFAISLLLVTTAMLVFVGQKKGFHEDEIFSFGSSNYKYNNIYYYSADRDATNRAIDKYIIADNFSDTMGNIVHFVKNSSEFDKLVQEEIEAEVPVWKTSEEQKSI